MEESSEVPTTSPAAAADTNPESETPAAPAPEWAGNGNGIGKGTSPRPKGLGIQNFKRVTSFIGQQEGVLFWEDLVKKWAREGIASNGHGNGPSDASKKDLRSGRSASPMHHSMHRQITAESDYCEDMVEDLYCIGPLISDVFSGIQPEPDGQVPTAAIAGALEECGLPRLDDEEIQKALVAVGANTAGDIDFTTFKDVAQKLLLSQFLAPFTMKSLRHPGSLLTITDYNAQSVYRTEVTPANLCEFFYGKRLQPDVSRWVHASDFDSAILMGIAVKYGLHPHAVEEVLNQSATKTDHYESAHLITVEMLALNSRSDGTQPVRVSSQHLTICCVGSGMNNLDTIITLTQDLKGFAQEWPLEWGGAKPDRGDDKANDKGIWMEKIQDRLRRPRSRLRTGGLQHLADSIMQLASSDLVEISDAYVKRIDKLEVVLRRKGAKVPDSWMNEVTVARRQIGVISRRIRGLQRAIRRLLDDKFLSTPRAVRKGSLEEMLDLLDEASERTKYTLEKAGSVIEDYRNATLVQEKREKKTRDVRRWNIEEERSVQANNQNNILLMLAIVTTIFTPLTFLCGIYGMNFVKKGKHGQWGPAMPELTWTGGYEMFWVIVILYVALTSVVACCVCWNASMTTEKYNFKGKRMQPNEESDHSIDEDPTQPLLAGRPGRPGYDSNRSWDSDLGHERAPEDRV